MEWKVERGETNKVKHALHWANITLERQATILQADDTLGATLIINGYQFQCDSVEDAKIEAEERVRTNRGIYLPWL